MTDASSPAEYPGLVLVVDDHPANRLLLRDLLEAQGYVVIEATNGAGALRMAADHVPDVILLDVQMPGMDGFEVCRRLRAAPETAAMAVLIVTALNDREHRLIGMQAGANDFLSKPIDTVDLTLRVRNAVRLRHLYVEVASQYQRLQELEAQRDGLVHMLVHDLRSPLTGITAYLQLIQFELEEGGANPDVLTPIAEARAVANNLGDMITNVLDVNRLEAGAMPLRTEPCELGAILAAAIAGLGGPAIRDRIQVHAGPAPVALHADPVLIRRVIVNLLANALKYSPRQEPVQIDIVATDQSVKLTVRDQGSGIPPEFRDKIFEKFGQVAAKEHGTMASTGLGLTFCKLAVEAHGGSIGVDSEVGHGSAFWFTLPLGRTAVDPDSDAAGRTRTESQAGSRDP